MSLAMKLPPSSLALLGYMKRPVIVAVPVTQIHCRAYMDHSRDWSVIEEAVLLMLALVKDASRVEDIVASAGLRHQIVVAALSRLMRFRLVEISTNDGGTAFVASQVGRSLALDGRPLPRLPQEVMQRFSFGVDLVCGSCFDAYDRADFPRGAIEAERQQGADVRILDTTGGGEPSISESSTSTLYNLIERGGERRLLRLATNETVFLRNRCMRLTVSGTTVRHFPAEPARTCASGFWKQRGPQGRSLSSPMPNQRSASQTCQYRAASTRPT